MDDQTGAKEFFVGRVIQQAEASGVELTPAERYMLSWSESDPNFEFNADLQGQFERNHLDAEFEPKVASLISQAYAQDVDRKSESRDQYHEAYKQLNQGDHYIAVMIEAAIGSKIRWFFF